MFTYVVLCHDYVAQKDGSMSKEIYISDDKLQLFKTKEDAFNAAVIAAESECNELNDGCEPDRHFGIPEGTDGYQEQNQVIVNCYDDSDNTETVTVRTICEVSNTY